MIHKAIVYAAIAHENQKRKGKAVPYIVHPFEVCQILTAANASQEVICAGLLHDTLEDTETTYENLVFEFGETIAKIVAESSEDKSLPWEERKQNTLEHVKSTLSMEALLVCCADKLSNLRSLKFDYDEIGDTVWASFKRGRDQQKWYYTALRDGLSMLSDYEMYEEMSLLTDELFK